MQTRRGRPFKLDAAALTRAGASAFLAVAPRLLGSMLTLPVEHPRVELRQRAAEKAPASKPQTIAIVSIDGPLEQRAEDHLCGYADGYDAIAERFGAACEDPDVAAVVLRINSPGGDLAGLEEGVRRMQEARDASGKPVLAYVDELVASAAYWIAAAVASGGIFLPTAGQVGSIGVIGAVVDMTGALEQEGIAVTFVRDPPGKAESHPYGPNVELAQARLGRSIADASGRFAAAMSAARGLSVEAIRALDADVLEGPAAVMAGLANAVASFEEVLTMAANLAVERNEDMSIRAKLGLPETASAAEVEKKIAALQAKARRAEDAAPGEKPEDDPPEDGEAAQMVTCPECGHEFEAMAPAQDAETAAAAKLGRTTIQLANAASAAEAEGAVRAWQASHGRVRELEAKGAETVVAEDKRRRFDAALVLARSSRGPGKTWGVAIAQGKEPTVDTPLHAELAPLPTATLVRMAREVSAPGGAPLQDGQRLLDTSGARPASVLTPEQSALCAELKLDPKIFAADVAARDAARAARSTR